METFGDCQHQHSVLQLIGIQWAVENGTSPCFNQRWAGKPYFCLICSSAVPCVTVSGMGCSAAVEGGLYIDEMVSARLEPLLPLLFLSFAQTVNCCTIPLSSDLPPRAKQRWHVPPATTPSLAWKWPTTPTQTHGTWE